jgi:geranylgeranyl diphosphate synthase type II
LQPARPTFYNDHSMEIRNYINNRRELVDSYLTSYLKRREAQLPRTLYEAIIYSLTGGKRLRPILVLAAAEALDSPPEAVLPTAAAMEMVHTYSLIHDDLPPLDDDDRRRGQPSLHLAFGEAPALLTGDALVPLGFALITSEQAKLSPTERVLQVITLLCEALGPTGMVGGQLLELELDGSDDSACLDNIYLRKTGALLGAAAAAGGVLVGGDGEQVDALRCYGLKVGVAYQVIDDLLDLQRDSGRTYPQLVGERRARTEAERLTAEAFQALEPLSEGSAILRELGEYLLTRRG